MAKHIYFSENLNLLIKENGVIYRAKYIFPSCVTLLTYEMWWVSWFWHPILFLSWNHDFLKPKSRSEPLWKYYMSWVISKSQVNQIWAYFILFYILRLCACYLIKLISSLMMAALLHLITIFSLLATILPIAQSK